MMDLRLIAKFAQESLIDISGRIGRSALAALWANAASRNFDRWPNLTPRTIVYFETPDRQHLERADRRHAHLAQTTHGLVGRPILIFQASP